LFAGTYCRNGLYRFICRIYMLAGGNVSAGHEFGIIDTFEEDKWYSNYEPEKYMEFNIIFTIECYDF